MAKKSTIIKNWPRYLLQWGVLLALIVSLTGLIPSEKAADPEAFCPMGGLQALATYLANNSLPCSMSMLQIMMGVALAAAVVLFSKLFCAYICPIGTVQDLIGKARKSLRIKGIRVRSGSVVDKILRIVKYALLFWIFYMTMASSELFCKNLDPYYAIATGFKGEITLWMSITTIALVVLGSFAVDMFWCRYLCPLGAISNSLKFWEWIGVVAGLYYVADVLGANIPWAVLLGAFCLIGYLLEVFHSKPKLQLLHIIKDEGACNGCGLCTRRCPYAIDVKSFDGKVNDVDCTLCGECVASCATGALSVGVCKPTRSKAWNFVPAVLTVALIVFGMWAGGKVELPTIDMKWGLEKVAEDGTVTVLVDEDELETTTIEGIRSIKCYGSAMALKAKLQKIAGVYGVKVFVKRHTADILHNPSIVSEEELQKAIYVPSTFRVNPLEPGSVDSLKVVVIRTEKMYDRSDVNFLGLQIRNTGRRIYGLESEFACPLIVRVYIHPEEDLDEDWFEELVESDVLALPTKGGEIKEIELDYEFVEMESEYQMISSEEYIRKQFRPFKAEFASRVKEFDGQKQYIYEIVDKNYDKPIILRNMPFLSNHLSTHKGIIGVYLNLNEELQPSIQIRYAAPMTASKVWELITMDTWTITYKKDDVRQEGAKLKFTKQGEEYIYE